MTQSEANPTHPPLSSMGEMRKRMKMGACGHLAAGGGQNPTAAALHYAVAHLLTAVQESWIKRRAQTSRQ